MRDRCANRTPNFDGSQRVTSPFLEARGRSGERDGFFDHADTHDLRALECLAGVMDRREVLVQSYREEGRHSGGAFFSRSLLLRLGPSVCVSTEPLLPANAALAVWPYHELDIGRRDSCRAFVHLVGALSPRRSLVRPSGDEGW